MLSIVLKNSKALVLDRKGITAMEYAILGAAIVLAVGGAMTAFKPLLIGAFTGLLPALGT
ncbi:MAG TPA: hypothetical protein VIL69_11650 [Roseomonas sp.]|jgi:Flp pilus assembly pilin Flp